MSRVGKEPVPIPDGVKVSLENGLFIAEGPKGRVSESLLVGIPVDVSDGVITVARSGDTGDLRSKHGLMRALIANAVHDAIGVRMFTLPMTPDRIKEALKQA